MPMENNFEYMRARHEAQRAAVLRYYQKKNAAFLRSRYLAAASSKHGFDQDAPGKIYLPEVTPGSQGRERLDSVSSVMAVCDPKERRDSSSSVMAVRGPKKRRDTSSTRSRGRNVSFPSGMRSTPAKVAGMVKVDREDWVENTGLEWNDHAMEAWRDMLKEFKLYVREKTANGEPWDGIVPETGERKKLGLWIIRQRMLYQSGKLTPGMELELRNAGMNWGAISQEKEKKGDVTDDAIVEKQECSVGDNVQHASNESNGTLDVEKESDELLPGIKSVGSNVPEVDQVPFCKTCKPLLQQQGRTVTSESRKRRRSNLAEPTNKAKRARTKNSKLMAKLMVTCDDLEKKLNENKDALEKMKKKNFWKNLLIAFLISRFR